MRKTLGVPVAALVARAGVRLHATQNLLILFRSPPAIRRAQNIADHRNAVRASLDHGSRVFQSDPTDSDDRLVAQVADPAQELRANHRIGIRFRGSRKYG